MKFIISILAIVVIFMGAKKLMCTPDQQVVEASLPLAKVMVEYVEKNGIPEYFNEIDNLPYDLKECSKSTDTRKGFGFTQIDNLEKCFFEYQGKKYSVEINSAGYLDEYYTVLYIRVKQYLTQCKYVIRFDKKNNLWEHENYPKPRMWKKTSSWICDPQPLRFTD